MLGIFLKVETFNRCGSIDTGNNMGGRYEQRGRLKENTNEITLSAKKREVKFM